MEQSELIDLVNQQNDKLNSFDQKFHEIFSQISCIKNENTVFRNNLNAITIRVDSESAVPKSNINQDIFTDFIDRQTCSTNIIIFSVHEQSNNDNITSAVDTVM